MYLNNTYLNKVTKWFTKKSMAKRRMNYNKTYSVQFNFKCQSIT